MLGRSSLNIRGKSGMQANVPPSVMAKGMPLQPRLIVMHNGIAASAVAPIPIAKCIVVNAILNL